MIIRKVYKSLESGNSAYFVFRIKVLLSSTEAQERALLKELETI